MPLVGGTGETAIWTVERTDHPDMRAESHQDPAFGAASWHPALVALVGRPLLILISGSPGAGKSTLGKRLSETIRLPHLNRDEIWSGLRLTHQRGAPEDVLSRGIVAEYGAVEHLLAVGVSLIADGTLYRGEFEANVRRLRDLAEVVNLHVHSSRATERFRARELAIDQPRTEFDRKMLRIAEIQTVVSEPLDLGCRLIEVSNEQAFDPSVEELASELGRT